MFHTQDDPVRQGFMFDTVYEDTNWDIFTKVRLHFGYMVARW